MRLHWLTARSLSWGSMYEYPAEFSTKNNNEFEMQDKCFLFAVAAQKTNKDAHYPASGSLFVNYAAP